MLHTGSTDKKWSKNFDESPHRHLVTPWPHVIRDSSYPPTHRHTDHATCDSSSKRPRLCMHAMRHLTRVTQHDRRAAKRRGNIGELFHGACRMVTVFLQLSVFVQWRHRSLVGQPDVRIKSAVASTVGCRPCRGGTLTASNVRSGWNVRF